MVGAPEKPLPVAAFGLILGRRSLSGSPIGGIAETQEMLDFCGEHNITADVEIIPIQKINEAYERMAQVRREVSLLHRHGFAPLRIAPRQPSRGCGHGRGLRGPMLLSPARDPGYAPSPMAAIGERNALRIIRKARPGAYLDGEGLGEILLPGRYVAPGAEPGDYVEVFVHRDSEDRLVATTELPRACVGEFAALKVVSTDPKMGAFLDWGLSKDLLLPRREQASPVRTGETVVICVLLDPRSQRLFATTRLERGLSREAPACQAGQKVRLLIAHETPLGWQALVERMHLGMLYRSETALPLTAGQEVDGYVRTVSTGWQDRPGAGPRRLPARGAPWRHASWKPSAPRGGRLPLSDQSSSEEVFGRHSPPAKRPLSKPLALFMGTQAAAERDRNRGGGAWRECGPWAAFLTRPDEAWNKRAGTPTA